MLIDLARTPVAEPLRALSAERRSGDLQVQSGRAVKTVFFDHGRIVFAASNLKKDRLGESLVENGRITEEQFREAEGLLKSGRHRRIGEALVDAGAIQKGELGRLVARQVKRIVLSLFSFTEGIATFEERESAIPLEFMVSLSLHRILYEGIALITRPELVRAGLGDLDRPVRIRAVAPFAFDVDGCSPAEREILEHARRPVTLRRLAWVPGGVAPDRLQAVYALFAAGLLVDARAPDEAPQPVINTETGTFLLSALQRQPDPTGRDAVRREVEEELARSADLDREVWLRVSHTAPPEELARALEEKMERYHALRDACAPDDPLRTDLEVILGRASALLRLARQASPDVPAVPAAPPAPADPPAAPTLDELVQDAEVRMTIADYASAVTIYQQVVERAPDDAGHRARLAVAMANHPPTAKRAEREFQEAIRLAPDDPDLHYELGLYYKVMKQTSRAVGELRTALRLDRKHAQARRELEELSPADNVLTLLKKLFR